MPMYTAPAPIAVASQALLDGLFGGLGLAREAAPAAVFEQWLHPRLLISQTCGYPLVTELRGRVLPLCVADYQRMEPEGVTPAAPLPAHTHQSLLVVRRSDPRERLQAFRGARAMINSRDSNTGMNLFRHCVAPLSQGGRFFATVAISGSHWQSMQSVAAGRVDIVAIDEITWLGYQRHAPGEIADLRVLTTTTASPALPFITSRHTPENLQADIVCALNHVVAAQPDIAQTLGIRGFAAIDIGAYEILLQYREDAARQDYSELQ